MDVPQRIGKFKIAERIGKGGFAVVHECKDIETGGVYAIKIGKERINDEYQEKGRDIEAMVYMEEWRAYKALNFGKDDANRQGIPEVVETGIAQFPDSDLHPYLVMQRLGECLSQAFRKPSFTKATYYSVAHAAIDCLQYVHAAGYVHRDVKVLSRTTELYDKAVVQTANFCLGKEGANRLYVLDLGLAAKAPLLTTRKRAEFVGTPDYAGTAALKGVQQSYRDDMEGLAYTLLEVWRGDLPWYLTGTRSVEQKGWTSENLGNMAARRAQLWTRLVKEGEIPAFLVKWLAKCKSLGMVQKPDYSYFHQLLPGAAAHVDKGKNKRTRSSFSQQDAWMSPTKRLCQAED